MPTFTFELVAPERLLASRVAALVTVPGSEGDFGVLPGHAQMISSLRSGVVDVRDEANASERFFVSGGFVEVGPERCTILAEEASPVSELNRQALEADMKAARDELATVSDDGLRHRLERRIAICEAKLAVAA